MKKKGMEGMEEISKVKYVERTGNANVGMTPICLGACDTLQERYGTLKDTDRETMMKKRRKKNLGGEEGKGREKKGLHRFKRYIYTDG